MQFDRITIDPNVMGGRPCIRGLRFPVSRILGLIAAKQRPEDILAHHPDLELEDIQQALDYAVARLDERVIQLKSA